MVKSLKIEHQNFSDTDELLTRIAQHRNIVRWYLMIYPYGRKGLINGLEREIARRLRDNEPPIEYFAPVYVEAKEVDNKIVNTEKQLFYNYVFVHASENEIFRMKKFEDQYNFPRRESTSDGEYFYPYVSDEIIRNLQWIAKSYSGTIPVYTGNSSWLVKGDRIRITQGQFKGVEARIFDNAHNNRKEIMVVVDQWMSVPLLHVKAGQYKVIGVNNKATDNNNHTINDAFLPELQEALCRMHHGETTKNDIELATKVVAQYANVEPKSDVMRSKLYAILLMAYTILQDKHKQASLIGIIQIMLPTLKAEQSKALLLTTVYGCTDYSIYYEQAHRIVDPWRSEENPKKSKKQLVQRLADFDECFNH